MSGSCFSKFSPSSFTLSGLIFKSLIHFELIFVYGYDKGTNSFFCIWISDYPSTIC